MATLIDKEEREKKRTARKEKKDIKLGAQVASETEKAGIDLKKPAIGPLGSEQKAEIDRRISSATEDDLKEGLSQFQKLYKAPEVTTPKPPSEDQLKRSVRRQKRAKIGDILTGISRGFKGQSIDPSQFRGSRIRKEREGQYTQYKGDVKAAKKATQAWGAGYAQKQIDYLEGLKKDSGMSDLKKKHIQAQIDKITAETKYIQNKPYSTRATKVKPTYTHQTEEGNWNITNQKLPYSDLYYKITGNSPNIINEVAKLAGHATDEAGTLKKNLSTAETERFSNTMLSMAFDIQVDENGNQIAIPKPGRENFMQDLSTSIALTNQIKAERKRINAERDEEIYNAEGSSFLGIGTSKEDVQEEINKKYDALIAKSEESLKQSESKLKQMLSGDYTSEAPPEEKPTPSGEQSLLDKIYNES